MSGTRSISLEIYVLKAERWSLHANYTVRQRDRCMADAKELDAKGRFDAVCVVRETYSEESNIARQAVIYHSPKLTSPPPVATVTERSEREENRPRPAPAPAPVVKAVSEESGGWRETESAEKRTEQSPPADKAQSAARPPSVSVVAEGPTLADVMPRLLGVACVSLMGALVIAYFAYEVVQFLLAQGIVPGKTMSQSIIIAVFLISFIFIFIPLLRRYVPVIQASTVRRETEFATPQPLPAPLVDLGASGPFEDDLETDPGFDGPEGFEEDDMAAENPDVGGDAPPAWQRTPLSFRIRKSQASEEEKPDVGEEMLKFIRDSLEPLAETGRPLDAFNRFGLTLFFAGAGEYMATRYELSEEEIAEILSSHVQILGHTAEMARGFCANINEYLINAKYFQMYDRGRNAVAARMEDPESVPAVAAAMDAWNAPAGAGARHDNEFVAVLFTDIVGSTAMTQERGDEAAQLVVREHNRIVRETLALYGGKEIKHTGDGIMATFSQIANAVEGAVAMQKACARANEENPALDLGMGIGVNAGEPIHEDGDVFGTPVQIAARVVSKAEVEEIAVSNVVRELCVGKGYSFSKKGEYELKGFPEPVPIFVVDWKRGLHAPEGAKKIQI